MQFQHEPHRANVGTRSDRNRSIVDGLVTGGTDLWLVVAREGEQIEEWFHGETGIEVAPLRVCRWLGRDGLVLDDPDPQRDRLLSEIEDEF